MYSKLLLITFLLLNSLSVYAGFFDKKLTVYDCKKNQYSTCKDGCDKTGSQFEFLINKKDNTVMLKSHHKGNITSRVFENCKIFNDKNWDCSSKDEVSINNRLVTTNFVNKMNDGIYLDISVMKIFSNSSLKTDVWSSYCAK